MKLIPSIAMPAWAAGLKVITSRCEKLPQDLWLCGIFLRARPASGCTATGIAARGVSDRPPSRRSCGS